jgi:hypothetical protein
MKAKGNRGGWWHKCKVWSRAVHIKQIRGHVIADDTQDKHHCTNCGTDFTGNYCPRCGQSQDTPRFTMKNLFHNVVTDFTDIESGFLRTIIELFWRPGYMIRDYIKGKRAYYFRPFKLLLIISTVSFILNRLFNPAFFQTQEEVNYNTINAQIERLKELALVPESRDMLDQMKALQNSILAIEMQAMQDSIRTGGDLSSFGITNDRIMERYNQWSEMRPEDSLQIENARMEYMRVQREMRRDVNSLRDRFIGDGSVLGNIYGIISDWFANNAALGMLTMLPIFLFCTWRSYRNTPLGRELNAAERIITFVYIASQIMIMQIVLVSIFGTRLNPIVFSIPTAFLLIWDFKQLYNLTWKNSIFRFVVYMCGYTVLIYSLLYFLFSGGYYLLYRSYL